MNFHPMDVNTNTKIRWEVIKKLPQVKALAGKKVLDLGAGLGYFSVKFSELDADVLAVDKDKSSLQYLSYNYHIKTRYLDVEKDSLPGGPFDLVFIGEILEHIAYPLKLFKKVRKVLSSTGVLLLTTPALEGWLIHTKGKRLGHREGVEKHEKDGFSLTELRKMFSSVQMKIVYHSFTIYTIAELFMQLTKFIYLRKNKCYERQVDILDQVNSFKYKLLRAFYFLLLLIFIGEQFLSSKLKMKGHCHIIVAQPS